MLSRKFCLTALLLLGTPALAQDKSITFNVSGAPNKTVHLLNGTSVSISTAGNLVAQCVPDANLNCADLGSGSTPPANAPVVSLQATGFSTAADVNGAYAAGTVVTLASAVTGADLCTKQIVSGTPSGTVWTGTISSGLSGTFGVTLPTASSTYGFSLKCWGSGGSTSSAAVTVNTNAGGGGGGGGDLACAGTNTAEAAGFVRSTMRTWEQFGGGAFPNFTYYLSQAHNQVGLVYLSAARNQYTAIEFTTPNDGWNGNQFAWALSQITSSPTATLSGAYVAISRCPGDFRFNIQDPVDSTDSQKCKGLRWDVASNSMKAYSSIFYTQDGISGATCGLQKGTKYYLNYINANPSDGIQSGEHTCSGTTCGFQFKIL